MTITLTPEQQAWIREHVASGEFASEEDAVRTLIDEQILQRELEDDDMEWAIPLIEEGLASIETHGTISLEEFKARSEARIAALMKE